MADVGLGQLATTTGRYVSRKLKDASSDSHPLYEAMSKEGGIKRIAGGRTIVDEALSGQNGTVQWVGESGAIDLVDYKVADAAEYAWKYMLAAVTWTLAERYQNSGGSETKIIDVVAAKFDAAKNSMMNQFHAGMLSNGTGSSGLELGGIAALVSTTPTTGTVGGINRASADATWFQNGKFNTGADWADGAVDAGNVLRFLDKMINPAIRNGKISHQLGFLGQTHWEYANSAIQARQSIVNVSGEGKVGFDRIFYRGIPLYYGNGVNYSGATAMTVNRSYLLNVQPGGVNLVFHKEAEFDMLEPIASDNQAAVSRLLFTMANMTIGGLAKLCAVGFD
jgi:hypothetical protein